jgi:hypothetical protein
MSTTATHYTKLYPKHGNLTGSPDQAYNLLPAKYFNHILRGIGAGTIATLGTVDPKLLQFVLHLCSPRFYQPQQKLLRFLQKRI